MKTVTLIPLRPRPALRILLWAAPLIVAPAFLLISCGEGPTAGTARDSGAGVARGGSAVDRGHRLFKAECASCHGQEGDRIPTVPLNSKEFLDLRGDATLMTAIRDGKGIMPAWGKERGGPFTDDQVRYVLAYLNAAAGRTSPALDSAAGRTHFQGQCARCHGEAGDRVPIAPLANKAFLDSRTDDDLLRVIKEGKGVMPPHGVERGGPLNDQQAREVVSYLRYSADYRLATLARRGRELYLDNCLTCHGERGDRVANVSLSAPDYLQTAGEGGLVKAISEGKGTMPGSARAKGGMLDFSEVVAIITYLKTSASLPAGAALAGPDQSGEGRVFFLKNCTGCHGEGGDKIPGVTLRSQEFLSSRSDEHLERMIGQGNTRGMPAFGKTFGGPLSDDDLRQVIAYLRASATTAPTAATNGSSAAAGGAAAAARASATPSGTAAARASATPSGTAAAARATAAATDPLVLKGRQTFNGTCAACHGETRDRIPQCRLADAAFLQERGDATLTQSITNGKGGMPAWGKEQGGPLAPEDIQAVLAYLKSAAGAR